MKTITDDPYQETYGPTEINQAQRQMVLTEKRCGPDCRNPKLLDKETRIDLGDGILVGGEIAYIYQNPSQLIKDDYLNEWFSLCKLSHQFQALPFQGGIYDQSTEFIEMFEIFSFWKDLAIQKEKSKNQN